jgi:hypothetical protein
MKYYFVAYTFVKGTETRNGNCTVTASSGVLNIRLVERQLKEQNNFDSVAAIYYNEMDKETFDLVEKESKI